MADMEEWAHFNVRCPTKLRNEVEQLAKSNGQSLAEWVRRAMQEKLERDRNGDSEISDADLNARIKAVVEEILEEKKREKE